VSSPDPLAGIADALYAGTPEGFVAARDAAAKDAVRDAGDKELAARVRKLRRPTVAAWAVNLLVRQEAEQIDRALEVGASLREAAAAMDADQLRALTRQRRQLTTALAGTARGLAREAGVRLSTSVTDQVEGVLNAAMLDPLAADAVRTGLLVTAFTGTGVGELDVAKVLAVPDALGARAEPREASPAPPSLHGVPESEALRRERAEDALRAAEEHLTAAEETAAAAEDEVQRWNARRLQLQDEIDELRRRVADLEEEADRADAELEEAEESLTEAREEVDAARAGREEARRRLG
jgi:hypothetical protein